MQAALLVLSKGGHYIVHGKHKRPLHEKAFEQSQSGPLAALTGNFETCHTDASIANLVHMLYALQCSSMLGKQYGCGSSNEMELVGPW